MKRKGLVLEGGGAKGAFHCGAVKALYDYGYTFSGVAGTSIGAINGALIVQDMGYQSMYDVWTNVTAEDITDFDNLEVSKLFGKELSKEGISYWTKQVISIIKNFGISTEKPLNYLKRIIDEDKVRSSPMDLGIVTYNLSDFEPLKLFKNDIPVGELHDFIFASAHYPAFRLEKTNGKIYIDGGVYDNLPVDLLASQNKYSEIFAIRTKNKPIKKFIEYKDVKINYICPSEDLGNVMSLYSKSVANNIKLGYYDALRFIKKYKGNKYYIEGDAGFYKKIFKLLNNDETESICKLYKIPYANFPYSFIQKESEENGWANLQDDEFILYFLEIFAKFYGVDKYKIYSPEQFLDELILKSNAIEPERLNLFKKYNEKYKRFYVFNLILPKLKKVLHG